ncbi:Gamma-tubulin complex component 2 [Perkinsus chesapeaki]|uniref:Gamma-tubulin complex component 2 n=1 Tax=Perkinsus chesapeaki TaxID=330153 RepID=A0A7J6L3R3_PERCH|nr:Gamma-tubulin complex component 2 [Perkinsus chesapeaki]
MIGFNARHYTVPEDPSARQSTDSAASDSNDDARAVFEGLKSASEAVASAANSAVGTVGGYLVRAGTAALQGLREEMKDDKNFVAADKFQLPPLLEIHWIPDSDVIIGLVIKSDRNDVFLEGLVGSAAVTGVARVFSGLNSAKTELQGAAADEVSKAAARKYGKDAGVMLRSSIATAGNAMSLLSVATPSNVVSQGMKKSSIPAATMTDGDTEPKVEEADLLGLESSEEEKDKHESKQLDKGDDKAEEANAVKKGDDKAEEANNGGDRAEKKNALNGRDSTDTLVPPASKAARSMDTAGTAAAAAAARISVKKDQQSPTNTASTTNEVSSCDSIVDKAPTTPSTEAGGDAPTSVEAIAAADHLALPPSSVA